MDKILCICSGGINRSGALDFVIRTKYKGASLKAGIDRDDPETLKMLYQWADKIILTQEEWRVRIPTEFQQKVLVFDVGPDIYGSPLHPELLQQFDTYCQNSGLFL